MHLMLLLICGATMLTAVFLTGQRAGTRKELLLILLFGLFAAYPLKAFLLHTDPLLFATYEDYRPVPHRIESYLAYIAFVALLSVGFLIPRTAASDPRPTLRSRGGWAYLNLLNAAALLLVALTFSGITSPTELLGAAARRQFLDAQQGSGWSSLLIVFSIPLLVLGHRSKKPLIFFLAFSCAFVALLVIGSRIYLFGYVIAFLICRFALSLRATLVMLSAFGVLGSIVYMGFVGDTFGDVGAMQMLAFVMHTFDGADILSSYVNNGQHRLYFGSTIVEDLFLTYFPRAIWEEKPYLFGAIRVTTDLFADLSDVQAIGATFPPGLFLEMYANFSILALLLPLPLGALLAWLSDEHRNSADPLFFALYVSLCSAAPGFFRGIGSIIAFVLPIIVMLGVLALARRLRV